MRSWCAINFIGDRKSLILTTAILSFYMPIAHASQWRTFLQQENISSSVFDSQNKTIWMGTYNDYLWRHDGKDFTKFDLSGSTVKTQFNIAIDGESIWVGTDGGLLLFEPGRGVTKSFHRNDGLVSDSVSVLFIDLCGNLWYGTPGFGIGKYDGLNWYRYDTSGQYRWNSDQWDTLSSCSSGNCPSDNYINAINGDSRGNKYFGTASRGLSFVDGADTVWTNLTLTDADTSGKHAVQAIGIDRFDHKWLGTLEGICELDANNTVVRCETATLAGLVDDRVNAIWIDEFNNKWIGTGNGISLLDSTGTRWKSFTAEARGLGPASNSILNITGDSDDNIWCGFVKAFGVSKYNNKWAHLTTEDSLSNNLVRTFDRDSKGNLWIATDQNGIEVFNGKSFIHDVPPCEWPSPRERPFFVTTVTRGKSERPGRVWVGTEGCGLLAMYLDGDTLQIENAFRRNNAARLPSNLINSIASLGDTLIWIGTNRGLCRLSLDPQFNFIKSETVPVDSLINLGLSGFVNSVVLDISEHVWVGTSQGLGKFDGRNWTIYDSIPELLDSHISAMCVDGNGAIWVGSNLGIARFWRQEWTGFTTAEGLPDNRITVLRTDPGGTVWCGTPSGAAKFDTLNQIWTSFTTEDGLSNNYVTDIAFTFHNVVWFSTFGGGLSRYHLTNIGPTTDILSSLDVTTESNVTFEFTGFDLNTPTSQLRYSHKLDYGSWSKPSFDTFRTLPIAEDGRHTFYVRAIDKDDNVDASEEILRFTKVSPDRGGAVDVEEPTRVQKYGSLWLYIPPNSIQGGKAITVTPLDSGSIEVEGFTGIAYDLTPHDLVIDALKKNKPMTLKIFYGDNVAEEYDERRLRIYQLASDSTWTLLGGLVDKDTTAIATTIKSLGTFGLFEAQPDPGLGGGAEITNVAAQPRILSPKGGGFLDKVTVSFDLGKPSKVTAKVYNLAGRLVRVLCENHFMNAGRNAIDWDGCDEVQNVCASGLYVVTIQAETHLTTKTVVVMNK